MLNVNLTESLLLLVSIRLRHGHFAKFIPNFDQLLKELPGFCEGEVRQSIPG